MFWKGRIEKMHSPLLNAPALKTSQVFQKRLFVGCCWGQHHWRRNQITKLKSEVFFVANIDFLYFWFMYFYFSVFKCASCRLYLRNKKRDSIFHSFDNFLFEIVLQHNRRQSSKSLNLMIFLTLKYVLTYFLISVAFLLNILVKFCFW